MISRRLFLQLSALSALGVMCGCSFDQASDLTYAAYNNDFSEEILKLQKNCPQKLPSQKIAVLIIGGGISGLLAARELERQNIHNYLILEREQAPGGCCQAQYSQNRLWPSVALKMSLPSRANQYEWELWQDLGLLKAAWSPNDDPQLRVDEKQLCYAPQTRLEEFGRWHSGLYPRWGASHEDLSQARRFDELLRNLAKRRDPQGRPWLGAPLAATSPEAQTLNTVSLAAWLERENFSSQRLHHYLAQVLYREVQLTAEQLAAGMALQLLARSQSYALNEKECYLTWPQGLAALLPRLIKPVAPHLQCQKAAVAIRDDSRQAEALVYDYQQRNYSRIEAQYIICALPSFMRRVLLPESPQTGVNRQLIAASLLINAAPHLPKIHPDFPISRYNALDGWPLGGYTASTSQELRQSSPHEPTVITFCGQANHFAEAAKQALHQRHYPSTARLKVAECQMGDNCLTAINQALVSHLQLPPSACSKAAISFIRCTTPGTMASARNGVEKRPKEYKRIAETAADLSALPSFAEAVYYAKRAVEKACYVIKGH